MERSQSIRLLGAAPHELEQPALQRTVLQQAVFRELRGEIARRAAAEHALREELRAEHHRASEQAERHLSELAHVTRLSTMGEMVSGLAHELKQPLSAINNYARLCNYRLHDWQGPASDDVRDALQQIILQATRAGEIIGRLRQFVRRAEPHRMPVDVNELARNIAALAQAEIRLHGVRLELALDDALPLVCGDRLQIEQVLINLLSNAIEALRDMPPGSRAVTIHTGLTAEHGLEVRVSDSGHGLSPDELPRLFEPFYTTKAAGMGLGLSISRSIIEAHGGRIEATAHRGCGATFRFTLPVPGEGSEP